ncbi:hypothetical protein CYMTET_3941 [Cymbomonas tetramitiformis]|uniref:Uncharacterized protein n=1 Tax=Cymbomonas tetramitiformis TaxID=36881 RepID=A0AAE0H400_9CHLO|nr:hypothetical protein CYMTET_3941 [Cymbomonas tetramitiformis]
MDDDAFWAAVDAVEESPDPEEEDGFWSCDAEVAADANAAGEMQHSACSLSYDTLATTDDDDDDDVVWARVDEDIACAAVASVALPLGGPRRCR